MQSVLKYFCGYVTVVLIVVHWNFLPVHSVSLQFYPVTLLLLLNAQNISGFLMQLIWQKF